MSGIMSWVTKPVSASVSAVPQPMMAATLLSGLDHFLYKRDRLGHLVAIVDGVGR